MRRRHLLLLLAGAMTAGRALRAQQKAMPVIGFLGSTSPGPFEPLLTAFHQGLSEAGYIGGQNVAIEYRWAEGHYDRLPELAADLVTSKVAVIVTSGSAAPVLAAKAATAEIPIDSLPAVIRSGPDWSLARIIHEAAGGSGWKRN